MTDVKLSRIYEGIVCDSGPDETAVVLVTGSRNWGGDPADIGRRLRWFYRQHPHTDRILLVGDCPGWRSVDRIAHDAAREAGFITKMFRANWAALGKAAGPARNRRMVELAALFAAGGSVVEVDAWPMPDSRGTIHCIQEARRAGLHVVVHDVQNRPPSIDAAREQCTIGTSAKLGGPRRRCERPRGPTTAGGKAPDDAPQA